MVRLNSDEFDLWAGYIYELTGIVLTPNKSYLIENRLADLVVENGCGTFKELLFKGRYSQNNHLTEEIINRISTQETSFFRDAIVYKALGSIINNEIVPVRKKAALDRGRPTMRIWSAACSHGQEPYSIAMVLHESVPDLADWDIRIVASDIADNAFQKASLGRYTDLEVSRGLDQRYLNKYFDFLGDHLWQVKEQLRNMIAFRRINLVTDPFSQYGPFDLILCRNVAIYFDLATKTKLFQKVEQVLAPDGRLFVGATESLSQIVPNLVPMHRHGIVYYGKSEALTTAQPGGMGPIGQASSAAGPGMVSNGKKATPVAPLWKQT